MKEAVCSKQAVKQFKGKHVLVTGASGSLGRAFGLHLARCGARTLVLSGRNEIFLQHLADECREISTSFMEVHVVPCDLSDPVEVMKLGNKALKLCTVNVLINNAAVMIREDFLETSPEVDQTMMQVNFLSGVALAKMLVPGMVERGTGTVLWISSVQGFCKCDWQYEMTSMTVFLNDSHPFTSHIAYRLTSRMHQFCSLQIRRPRILRSNAC